MKKHPNQWVCGKSEKRSTRRKQGQIEKRKKERKVDWLKTSLNLESPRKNGDDQWLEEQPVVEMRPASACRAVPYPDSAKSWPISSAAVEGCLDHVLNDSLAVTESRRSSCRAWQTRHCPQSRTLTRSAKARINWKNFILFG